MSTFFNVKITGGTSPGPYTIYYDQINPNSIATNFISRQKTQNLSLEQLNSGVIVEIPDDSKKIILNNIGCNETQIFELKPKKITYPCLCVVIFDKVNDQIYNNQFCYSDNNFNEKPLYTGSTDQELFWNSNSNFWEISNFNINNTIFRSNDVDMIPDTNWYAVGESSSDFIIITQTGTCSSVNINTVFLNAKGYNPTCSDNDGYITAVAVGGSGGWKYSINNQPYQQSTIFSNLSSGNYTVRAKDSSENITTQTIDLIRPERQVFSIEPKNTLKSMLNKVGNTQQYLLEYFYDTTQIPDGVQVTFDLKIEYDLIYKQPGVVSFTTSQNEVMLNSMMKSVNEFLTIDFERGNPPLLCNSSLFPYLGSKIYKSPQITISKNDILSVKLVYGIDTQTDGGVDGNCRTEGSVTILVSFENVQKTCSPCCEINQNLVNTIQSQIFI